MKRKKTAKKPAKVLRKKRPQPPVEDIVEVKKKLSPEEIGQIHKNIHRLFDIAVFGEIEPTKSTIGLALIKERMQHGK
jgi:hypothetical protein